MNEPSTDDRGFGRHLYLLAATFLFIFMGAGAQQAYLVPYLRHVTPWSPVMCSSVIASVYLSMLVFRVLNVYLFASWSDRLFTAVGSCTYLGFTLAMLLIGKVPSYPLAMLAAFVWGIGGAMMWAGTAMQTMALADRAGGRHGTGIGIVYSSTHAGWLSGVILLGIVYRALPDTGKPLLYVLAAGLTLIGNVLAFTLPATGRPDREPFSVAKLLDTVRDRRIAVAGVLQLASALSFGFVLGAFSSYIEQAYGSGWIWISVAFYPATRMVMSFVSGRLADWAGHAAVLVGGFLCGAAGLLVALLWKHPLAGVVAGLALGLLSSTVPVAATALIGNVVDRRSRPLAYGVVFSWRDLGVATAAIGSSVLGFRFSFDVAFGVFAAVFLACAVLAATLHRPASPQESPRP